MRFPRRQQGVTLIELMIATVIALGATAATYSLFLAQSRSMAGQQSVTEMQDNARVAMDWLVRDIRNAGFLVPPAGALRIENNCGRDGHDVNYAGGVFAIEGGNTAMDNGNLVKSSEADGCPNGSDRITLTYRPRNDVASACGPMGCLGNNAGSGTEFRLPCEGATNATNGDCAETMEKVAPDLNLPCTGCTTSGCNVGQNVTICNNDDPTSCLSVKLVDYKCDQSCPIDGSGGGNLECIKMTINQVDGSPFSNWTGLGGKNSAAINAFTYRSYQIMDLDLDGSTELAFSDVFNGLMASGSTVSANWTPVANYIDDLQFAYSLKNAPGTFYNNRSIWNLPGCTQPGDVHYQCLTGSAGLAAGGNPPIAIRVSIVARSAKREFASNQDVPIAQWRPPLEDNSPAETEYVTTGFPTGGALCYSGAASCGCGATTNAQTYARCSENGNARGYRRRVYSEIVGLRNLQGFTF